MQSNHGLNSEQEELERTHTQKMSMPSTKRVQNIWILNVSAEPKGNRNSCLSVHLWIFACGQHWANTQTERDSQWQSQKQIPFKIVLIMTFRSFRCEKFWLHIAHCVQYVRLSTFQFNPKWNVCVPNKKLSMMRMLSWKWWKFASSF